MQTKRLTPEAILQKANMLKDRFASSKGRSDQILADSLSETMVGMIQMIQALLQDRSMDDARIKSLEEQNKKLQEQLPKQKKLPKSEKPAK